MTENGAAVIVGVDGSASSKNALRWAFDYTVAIDAPIEALIAWDVPTNYGMPVLFDENELEEPAQTAPQQAVREVLGDEPRVHGRW
ncbi:MAG TPA: universal stress protein [Candidatus Nanopelagicales bacterium]